MNIKVIREEMLAEHIAGVGGEWAVPRLEIYVDKSLAPYMQRGLVIHAIIENYNRGMSHDKVEELTNFIQEGLDQLEE